MHDMLCSAYGKVVKTQAPKATEAMCAIGWADAVMPWIQNFRRLFTPRPRPSVSIDADRWRDALGVPGRFADWSVFFQIQLKKRPWAEVGRKWAALRASGLIDAAQRGVIHADHDSRHMATTEAPTN